MDRLRAAEGPARKQALQELESLPLRTPKVKNAQTACAAAYRKLHEATTLVRSLENKRNQGKLDLRALKPLQESQRMIAEAKAAGKKCEAHLLKLKMRRRW